MVVTAGAGSSVRLCSLSHAIPVASQEKGVVDDLVLGMEEEEELQHVPRIIPTTIALEMAFQHSTASLSYPPGAFDSHLQKQVYTSVKEQGPAWVHIPSGSFPR